MVKAELRKNFKVGDKEPFVKERDVKPIPSFLM